ncbi:MAG TPA: hypothetical protein VNN25_15520 [Thermoanaerobaculia bacterium]|nr:hypothetical protein [Thermoanaerobaculia bacterium]
MKKLIVAMVLAAAPIASAQDPFTHEDFDRVLSGAAWNQSPASFRGIPFGGTESDLIAVLGPVKCADAGGVAVVRQCRATRKESRMMVDGVVIEDFYRFHAGKLVEVLLERQRVMGEWGPAPSYASVLSVFSEKYGPPTETWKTRNKGVRGIVPFEAISASAKWQNDQISILIDGGDGSEFSYGIIQTGDWLRELAKMPRKNTTSF